MSADSVRSRRALLTGAVGAVAATSVASVAAPGRALAASDDGRIIHVGDSFGDVRSVTFLQNTMTSDLLLQLNASGGGVGLQAYSTSDVGVFGSSQSGSAAGVEGANSSGAGGYGVEGRTDVTTGETWGVYGHMQSPDGAGVFGYAKAATGGMGVYGEADTAMGVGVRGLAWDGDGATGMFGTGVLGSSGSHPNFRPAPLPNTGVYGIGFGGRGLVGQGDKAQLKLVPSTATSHPPSGQRGDLFVDKSGRLWFCKGGTTWKPLA